MDLATIKLYDVITIPFLASDFIRTSYSSNSNCALSKACKRNFETENVSSGSVTVDIAKGNNSLTFQIDFEKFNFDVFKKLQKQILEDDIEPNKLILEVNLTCIRIR